MQNDGYIIVTVQTSNNDGFWISYDNNAGSHMVDNTVSSDNNVRNISLYAPKGTIVYTRSGYGTYNLTVYEWEKNRKKSFLFFIVKLKK